MEELNTVNSQDQIIGTDSRENIHTQGLCHREVHVWVIHPKKGLLFQKRAKNKETWPGLYDASAGGHVDIGEDYLDAAVRELAEETGITVNKDNLVKITKTYTNIPDTITGKHNHCFRMVYAYVITNDLNKIKIETGKADSLDFFPFEQIIPLNESISSQFIPKYADDEQQSIFKKLKDLANNTQIQETSAGGIVINSDGQIALAQHEDGAWSLPKGHVEANEDLEAAAKREIYEETGISHLKLIKQFPSYQRPDADRPNVLKTINIFLFKTEETELKPTEKDIIGAKWVDKEQVAKILSYQKDKEFFNSAISEI
jgi:ADP-ribose pyrophosphatase YjhB (NUDIX family)